MMNRTGILLLISIGIVGLVFVVKLSSSSNMTKSSTLGEDRIFKVDDVASVGKIFLAHRDGETVTLERQGRFWLYNDTFRASKNAIENLLHAIGEIQLKYKPADAAVQNMVEDLATFGIKVMVYDLDGKILKTYYVGGGTADERGTHVIMEGSEQPYVAHLPNWEGNLRFRYNLKGDDWRDKSVFAEDYRDVIQISIEYPRQRDKSFVLTHSAKDFVVEPFYTTTPEIQKPLVPGRSEAFLYAFESIGAEAFENTNPRQDSIRGTLPFSVITVERADQSSHVVRLWPVRPLTTVWNNNEPIEQKPIERYFAGTDKGDFFLVQHRVFQEILMPYAFFYGGKD